MLTTIKVAMARQTASDSVNFQMARMQRTVQATSETAITTKAIQRTIFGLSMPRRSIFNLTTTSVSSSCVCRMISNQMRETHKAEITYTMDKDRSEWVLFCFSLICDSFLCGADGFRITEVVAIYRLDLFV